MRKIAGPTVVVFIGKKQTREREKETAMIRDGTNDVTSHKERREITIAHITEAFLCLRVGECYGSGMCSAFNWR